MTWHQILILILLELLALLGGVFCCLVGFRIYEGGARVDRAAWEAWYRRSGRWLRYLGPFMLLLALLLPMVMGATPFIPPAVPRVGVIVILALGIGFGIKTWRSDPPVPWPRGWCWCWTG